MEQNTLVESLIKNFGSSFASAAPESLPQESFATEYASTSMGTTAKMMSSPGASINAMNDNDTSFDSGNEILNNPDTQQEFLNHQQQAISVFDQLPTDKQARFNEGIMNEVQHSPNVAGNMLNDIRNGQDNMIQTNPF